MRTLWNSLAVGVVMLPFAVGAQEAEAPAAGHHQHQQHAAPSADATSPGPQHMRQHMQGPMQQQMADMHAAHGMMQQRVRLLEERLESLERQLQQLTSRLEAVQKAGEN